MQHTSTLHIFIGENNHFFTLRESYLHTMYINRQPIHEVRYDHLKNLAQNWEEAVIKAKEASKNFGIPLRIRENELEQLNEIKRISKEEAENHARALEEAFIKAEEEAEELRRRNWEFWKTQTLGYLNGNDEVLPMMVGGAHHSRPLSEVPMSYLQWMVFDSGLMELDPEETMNHMAFVAHWLNDNVEIRARVESEWVGEIKEKVELDVYIDSVRTLDGTYGLTYMYKMTDSNGNDILWYASRNALEGLNNIKIIGTVKSHGEYNGRKQTVLTRVKVK